MAGRGRMVLGIALLVFLAGALPARAQDDAVTDEARSMVDELTPEVERIRGWAFKRSVDMKVYSEDQLRDYVLQKLDEEYPDEDVARTESFLQLVGALPDSVPLKETIVEVLISQIGGFYDPSTQAFYMIERDGVDFGPTMDRILVAHELTHALDDQYVSLDSLLQARERTEDGEFVGSSLVEGSATAVMTKYVTDLQLSGKLTPEILTEMMESEKERSTVFYNAPRYFQTLIASYTCGMSFLLQGNLAAIMSGGEETGKNFLTAVDDPPTTSEQILHPEKYWVPEARDHPVLIDDAGMKKTLEGIGYTVDGVNTAGEIMVAVVTTPSDRELNAMASGMPNYWTNDAATGWGGDRFFLLRTDEGRAGVWITAWDSQEDRDAFVETYSTEVLDTNRSWFALKNLGAGFVFGLDEEQREAIERAILRSRPSFTQNGKRWTP